MLISDLKNKIVTGEIDNFYVFTGEEEGIMDIYIHQIVKKLNLTIKWVDSVVDITKLVNLKSLVKVNYLYLVRQDNVIIKQETAWQFIKNGIIGSYVILIQPTIDKKTKFYKFFEDNIIQFDKLSNEMLMNYGHKKCPDLTKTNLQSLVEWCGFSYLRLMNELDKIDTLSKSRNINKNDSFNSLDKDKGIYKERQFDVFQYVQHIINRNAFACYQDLDYVKNQKCEILIVNLLQTAFRGMVLLKNDGGGKGVCERTGLTGWQVKNAIECDEFFTVEEAENRLLLLNDIEVKLKTGVIAPNYSLDYILAEVL